jgi:hypothetical protein
MICPLDVIALLVGLQGDISEEVQRRSLRIIQLEDVKHANFLDNRLCEGVELIPQLQMQSRRQCWALLPVPPAGSPVDAAAPVPVSVTGTLYITCFRSNRKRRTDFLTSLLRRCDNYCNITGNIDFSKPLQQQQRAIGSSPASVGSSPRSALGGGGGVGKSGSLGELRGPGLVNLARTESRVEFLATTLAYIPFSVQDEPLLVVSWLNRNATVQTELFLKRFRDLLLSAGAAGRRDGAMQGPMEGSGLAVGLKRGGGGGGAGDTGRAEGYVLEETLLFDEDSFQSHLKGADGKSGAVANAIGLRYYSCEARCRERLVLLKHFLKYAYVLSPSLCVAHSADRGALDKSRRPKRRAARGGRLAPASAPSDPGAGAGVGAFTEAEPAGLSGEEGAAGEDAPAAADFSASSKSGWNSSVSFSEYAIKHPYSSITPRAADSAEPAHTHTPLCGGSPHASGGRDRGKYSDHWTDTGPASSHSPSTSGMGGMDDVAAARQVLRKAMSDFNRLVTLHFNGFEHHVLKDNSASKKAKRYTDADTTGKNKQSSAVKMKKRGGWKRKRRMYSSDTGGCGSGSEGEGEGEDFFDEDDDEYVP